MTTKPDTTLALSSPRTSSSSAAAVVVPNIAHTDTTNTSSINHQTTSATASTVRHRHTKETISYCRETDEDFTTAMTGSHQTRTNTEQTSTRTSNAVPKGEEDNVSPAPSTASSVTDSNTSSSPTPPDDTEEPYQELKWTSAPLFLNDTTFDTTDLSSLTSTKQTLPLHAGSTALLVVDVQPEYWSQCPAVRQDFPDFPARLAQLVAQCRAQKSKIIWVRADYRYAHSPWLVQFARLHSKNKDGAHNTNATNNRQYIPAEVHSNPHENNIQWEDFATPVGGEYIIPKTSWSSTRHTALMDLLKQSGIDTVLVAGLITSVCVQHSAFGIFEAGYRTLLVTDACADRGRARHDAALALYGDYMYELVTVEDLCRPRHPYYLRPAEPVWLTPASVQNLVQPQFFNSLQDSVVHHHTGTSASSSNKGEEEETATQLTSNLPDYPTFYKMEEPEAVPTKRQDGPTLPNAAKGLPHSSADTARTSTSSLSTLTGTNPSPLLEPLPLTEGEEPPAAIEV